MGHDLFHEFMAIPIDDPHRNQGVRQRKALTTVGVAVEERPSATQEHHGNALVVVVVGLQRIAEPRAVPTGFFLQEFAHRNRLVILRVQQEVAMQDVELEGVANGLLCLR